MNEKQFSDRIGNVNDKLIRQAEQIPNYRRGHRRRSIRQLATIAAVIALMVCSFSVGALAFAEKIYVEKSQESIDISDFGISLILPDEWAGKYGYDIFDDGGIEVYSLAAREEETDNGTNLKGSLFWVECIDGQFPMDFSYAQPGYTIATTATHTFRLVLASDVQYDSGNAKIADEYLSLYDSIPQIKILLSDWLTDNSLNQTNWVKGTVYVKYLGEMTPDGQDVVKTVVLDEAASTSISQIIKTQKYDIEDASFPVDLVFIVDGQSYHMYKLGDKSTQDINMRNRDITNMIDVLDGVKSRFRIETEVAFITEKFDEYKELIGKHIDDREYLEKSQDELKRPVLLMSNKLFEIALSLYN